MSWDAPWAVSFVRSSGGCTKYFLGLIHVTWFPVFFMWHNCLSTGPIRRSWVVPSPLPQSLSSVVGNRGEGKLDSTYYRKNPPKNNLFCVLLIGLHSYVFSFEPCINTAGAAKDDRTSQLWNQTLVMSEIYTSKNGVADVYLSSRWRQWCCYRVKGGMLEIIFVDIL